MTEPTAPRRGWLRGLARALVTAAVLGGAAAGAVATRERWQPVLFPTAPAAADDHDDHGPVAAGGRVILSEPAQKNLRLETVALRPETFWKTAAIPGMVIDRPGVTDRGVVAPATGVVARVHKVAGDPVRPGDELFTLKLISESLHLTQTELFKAAQDAELAKAQRRLLAASPGSVPEARLVEADNQLARLAAAIRAYRQDLLNRGLTPAQVDAAAGGSFATEMRVLAPGRGEAGGVEVQEVRVELGQQVLAGQTMCLLADHRLLAVEGRAFPDEAPLLDRAAREGWPVEIDFGDDGWPPLGRAFQVGYVASTIDPEMRTFRFRFPLDNPSRPAGGGREEWRFRPGQRVRLLVRVEKLENVFVLPADAVAREGADAFVFRRSGDAFDRKPVHVVYQDRTHAVVANDGSVPPGVRVATTGAATLNRMTKAASSAVPAGFHVHADGSVHMGSH